MKENLARFLITISSPMLSSSTTPWNSSEAVLFWCVSSTGAHTSATAQGVSNVWEWTPATSGGFFNNEGISSKHEERSKKKPERSPCHEHWETFRNQHWVLGCVLPITWMCQPSSHRWPRSFLYLQVLYLQVFYYPLMAFMGSKHIQHTPKNGVWWVWGGKIMENHSIYLLII